MLICPNEVELSELIKKNTFSPRNLSRVNIPNPKKITLSHFLDSKIPYNSGEEPGSFAYIPHSDISFVRNSCIDSLNISNQENKEIFLNPKYGYKNNLLTEDVLFCKDANIGDSCLFLSKNNNKYVFSSGIVKLNFKNENEKYYCLAFIRDEYFRNQLYSITPRGSTIKHAGSKFLDCFIPEIHNSEEELFPLIKSCLKNAAYSEKISNEKLKQANQEIKREFLIEETDYKLPSISNINSLLRLDAGYYSEIVNNISISLNAYSKGTKTINEFGFDLKRGPNLAKRDLGRSIISEVLKKKYHLLVYPSDISDRGYILKEIYLGARNPVWYLKSKDILFSAEGTVGKVFVICDEQMKFVTNFHGLIITPNRSDILLEDSIILGQYLNFLRSYGYFDKVSVGGQGGSFAINYWEDFRIPNFDKNFKIKMSKFYHNQSKLSHSSFNINELENAGVFELNQFRIECQEIIKSVVNDIKKGSPRKPDYYLKEIT